MNTKIKIEERVQRLVLAIGEEIVPRKGLIATLGLRQDARRNFYHNYLNPARERGLVVMQYPDVPSLPEQAYLLTEKGKDLLRELKKGRLLAIIDRTKWRRTGPRELKKGTGCAGKRVKKGTG